MKKHTHSLWGIVVCVLLLAAVFIMSDGRNLMLNLEGLVVVVAGTIGATFISYPKNAIQAAVKVAINSYKSRIPSGEEIVDSLLDLSIKSRIDGLLALEEEGERSSVLFLERALSMLVDGFSQEDMRDALYTEINFFQQRRNQHERVFRHMALLAPAFGVAGGVIGLIGMLGGIKDSAVILHTIPVALTSTLYGVLMAYFLCIPVAENIHAKTEEELLILKLITDGVTLIGQEYNTLRLQTRLQSFVTPQLRTLQHKSLKEIRSRYAQMKSDSLNR
ncbi:chemotaxis protein MotA [Novimethylophilus kurashikiensis]|uniref:Chemotaxis protein MotA n=1 Tax=Novimethylophilus kurashikiensis TaxID=1825523 RepID=A0A2R5FC08_9PROT|nr:MotA/TolQ/ExbB proton channel family protein [Novimethylophilus kurashikiensis]GBG15752.1 chemotaxis protein MotA [Novimethylophilus kurashikiensis]